MAKHGVFTEAVETYRLQQKFGTDLELADEVEVSVSHKRRGVVVVNQGER
jgi:hypothetical protein